jgi:cytidylate kinase
MAEPVSTPVIAIDGPSGSGKGTIARAVAAALGWNLLDSGALYRIVACAAIEKDVDVSDEQALAALAGELEIVFSGERVVVDGRDVTDAIRSEAVSAAASEVAALQGVRSALGGVQRSMRTAPGLVADGRDMGTVVFPDAELKIYLDASVEERAQRRYKQLKNKGLGVSLRDLLASLTERDERDTRRAVSPLKLASDAILIDSTSLSIEQVVARVVAEAIARDMGERA